MTDFPPNRQTALERTDAIDPARYARTCNHLDGAVSRLSPYLTHGVVSVPEVIARLATRGIRPDDRIVMELAWREYWQHAWRHLGKAIFDGRQPLPASGHCHYAAEVPADVRQARSGVCRSSMPRCGHCTTAATCTTMPACGWPRIWCICARPTGATSA